MSLIYDLINSIEEVSVSSHMLPANEVCRVFGVDEDHGDGTKQT